MNSEFVDYLSNLVKTSRRDLVEKDVVLHEVLLDLSRDSWFSENFMFKGGTCLTKQYLGYFRFSEDLDFTWYHQGEFNFASGKKLRMRLSEIIAKSGNLFEHIASRRELDFHLIKSDRKYVELGGSNRFCTFKFWYDSVVLKRKTFFKVQINFIEELCFGRISGQLKSLVVENEPEMEVLFDEYREYSQTISFWVYDLREIVSEKIRAVLTRRGLKMRDYIDIFMVDVRFGIRPSSLEDCTLRKIRATLGLYEKYRKNLKNRISDPDSITSSGFGAENEMLLVRINTTEFTRFMKDVLPYVKALGIKASNHN